MDYAVAQEDENGNVQLVYEKTGTTYLEYDCNASSEGLVFPENVRESFRGGKFVSKEGYTWIAQKPGTAYIATAHRSSRYVNGIEVYKIDVDADNMITNVSLVFRTDTVTMQGKTRIKELVPAPYTFIETFLLEKNGYDDTFAYELFYEIFFKYIREERENDTVVSINDIDRVAERFSLEFADDFTLFLWTFSRCRLKDDCCVKINDTTYPIAEIIPLQAGEYSIENLMAENQKTGRLPNSYVPFAGNDAGNILYYDVQNKKVLLYAEGMSEPEWLSNIPLGLGYFFNIEEMLRGK